MEVSYRIAYCGKPGFEKGTIDNPGSRTIDQLEWSTVVKFLKDKLSERLTLNDKPFICTVIMHDGDSFLGFAIKFARGEPELLFFSSMVECVNEFIWALGRLLGGKRAPSGEIVDNFGRELMLCKPTYFCNMVDRLLLPRFPQTFVIKAMDYGRFRPIEGFAFSLDSEGHVLVRTHRRPKGSDSRSETGRLIPDISMINMLFDVSAYSSHGTEGRETWPKTRPLTLEIDDYKFIFTNGFELMFNGKPYTIGGVGLVPGHVGHIGHGLCGYTKDNILVGLREGETPEQFLSSTECYGMVVNISGRYTIIEEFLKNHKLSPHIKEVLKITDKDDLSERIALHIGIVRENSLGSTGINSEYRLDTTSTKVIVCSCDEYICVGDKIIVRGILSKNDLGDGVSTN